MNKKTFKATEIKNSSKESGIYGITFKKTKRFYIGSAASKMGFYGRWRQHLYFLRKNEHHSPALQNAFNKYGETNILFKELLRCPPNNCLKNEQNYIEKFNSYSEGYNGRPKATNNKGIKWTERRRKNHFKKFAIIRKTMVSKIKKLYEQNISTREIANRLKISRTYIKRIFDENGINAKTAGETRRKQLLEIDKNGNFIKEWESINKCSQTLNLNKNSIRLVLIGKCNHAKGHFFKLKT